MLASIAASSQDAILSIDAGGVIVWANAATERVLGWSPDELVGRPFAVLVPDESRAHHDSVRERILAGDPVPPYVARRVGRDGTVVDVAVTAGAVCDADGRVVGISSVLRDVTEQLRTERDLRRALEAHRARFEQAVVPQALVALDGTFLSVNRALCRMLGRGEDELVGSNIGAVAHPLDSDAATAELIPLTLGEVESATYERLARRVDGQGFPVLLDVTLLRDADGTPYAMAMFARDITEQVEAEQALRDSESRYRAIVRTAQEGIIAVDAEGRTVFANDKIAEITGVPLEAIYRDGLLRSLPPQLASGLERRRLARVQRGPEEYEVGYRHPDGRDRILSISSSPLDLDDGHAGVLGMVSDVTDARQTETRLRWQALHDPLTGLPNRSLLADRLQMAAARRDRTSGPGVAVLFMDLDQFKLVNDSRGHEVGDRLLCEVARRLQATVRRADTVARLGGDEFAIVCEDIDEATTLQLAARIHDVLREPVDLDGEQLYVGTSIGIAMCPPHPAEALLRFADAAMYRAKSSAEQGTVLFDQALATDSERRFEVSNALRESLHANHVRLVYQPIHDLTTGTACGVEALLHGIDARCGEVPARELMDTADESGLSFELDRAVLQAAVSEFAGLRAAGAVPPGAYVSVNLSTRTLGRALDDVVDTALADAELPGSCLLLEFTDNSIMADADHAIASLARLRERGVGTSIDNFGNGNSSLVHLRHLPLTALKIDPWFVEQVVVDPVGTQAESIGIVRAVISLAQAIGLCTLAGGIETREQAEAMRRIGCERGAGPYWTAPVTADEVARVFVRG